jgi:Tfp pilus assembly protein PilF
MQTGKLDAARQHLEQALAVEPRSADAHFNLGSLLAAQQQMDEASEHYRTAARLDPRYARLLGIAPPE